MAYSSAVAGPNGIRITKVEVKAPTKGVMTVAALDEEQLGVVFDTNEDGFEVLELTDRGAKMNVPELVYGEKVVLGESMLLPAGVTEYVVNIYYERVKGDVTIKDVYSASMGLPSGRVFEAGIQYDINIKFYDFHEVLLTINYSSWTGGGDVELDSEE